MWAHSFRQTSKTLSLEAMLTAGQFLGYRKVQQQDLLQVPSESPHDIVDNSNNLRRPPVQQVRDSCTPVETTISRVTFEQPKDIYIRDKEATVLDCVISEPKCRVTQFKELTRVDAVDNTIEQLTHKAFGAISKALDEGAHHDVIKMLEILHGKVTMFTKAREKILSNLVSIPIEVARSRFPEYIYLRDALVPAMEMWTQFINAIRFHPSFEEFIDYIESALDPSGSFTLTLDEFGSGFATTGRVRQFPKPGFVYNFLLTFCPDSKISQQASLSEKLNAYWSLIYNTPGKEFRERSPQLSDLAKSKLMAKALIDEVANERGIPASEVTVIVAGCDDIYVEIDIWASLGVKVIIKEVNGRLPKVRAHLAGAPTFFQNCVAEEIGDGHQHADIVVWNMPTPGAGATLHNPDYLLQYTRPSQTQEDVSDKNTSYVVIQTTFTGQFVDTFVPRKSNLIFARPMPRFDIDSLKPLEREVSLVFKSDTVDLLAGDYFLPSDYENHASLLVISLD